MTRAQSALVVTVVALLAACGGGGTSTTGPSQYGNIQVTITGLPGSTAARVTLAGPGGLLRTVTASGLLTGATPGTWTVQARHVVAGGQDYIAPALAPITVTAPDTASIVVNYSANPLSTFNFYVATIDAIQSVQRDDNSVPLVAGRPLFIRVYALSTELNTTVPTVRLRLYGPAGVFDSITIPAPVIQTLTVVNRYDIVESYNVTIPAVQVIKGLRIDAVVDPDDDIGETNESDNRWPAAGTLALDVRTVPPLQIRFVPVVQSVNGLRGGVTNANKAAYAELTGVIYPLGTVTAALHPAYTTSAPVLQSDDGNGAWSQVLGEINALRVSEGSSDNYYGVVATTYSSGIAGLGYIGTPAAIGWDKGSSVGGIVAHELGHNFGRSHAPCGTAPADPNYPYPNAQIGVWGYNQIAGVVEDSVTTFDLMSYCSPIWISDYTYEGVLSFRGSSPMVLAAPDSGLLVWGRMRGDSLVLEPGFVVKAPARLPAADGPYRLTGLASDGTELFQLSFAGDEVPDLPGGAERHFAFVIPLSEAAPDRLASMVLTGPRGTALRRTAALGGAVPGVAVTSAGADQVQVTWDKRYPMALVRDAATGQILSFARGGSAVVAASGPVRVELSRGTGSVRGTVRK
jgi:hypothetical protein